MMETIVRLDNLLMAVTRIDVANAIFRNGFGSAFAATEIVRDQGESP